MKIKIERKSPYTHQIFEIENVTLIAESYQKYKSYWCALESNKKYDKLIYGVPMEGTIEISAI
jgi:hypothetical protein